MKLLDDWKGVLRRAWSIRLILLAGLLSGIEVALPLLDGVVSLPRGLFACLSLVMTAAAFVARLLAQKEVANVPAENP
jgi:hypothetical protein